MKKYIDAVFIGRFQPFHRGHLEIIKHGLKISEFVTVMIGSTGGPRTPKNPFNFNERCEMIQDRLNPSENKRIRFMSLLDFPYDDKRWAEQVRFGSDYRNQTALLGSYTDESSYYLKYFSDWTFEPIATKYTGHAADIRKAFFNLQNTKDTYLNDWAITNNGIFNELIEEFKAVEDYKEAWSVAPYRPVHATVDAVVICNQHVLTIRRKTYPGKGLLALPGGFVEQYEYLKDAALRELFEETNIKVAPDVLEKNIVTSRAFDRPDRSQRGRTITNAFLIKLDAPFFPSTHAGDDAQEVIWLPLDKLDSLRSEFYEDHLHIVKELNESNKYITIG